MKISIDQNLINDRYISVQKHERADLFIYNYTQKCQFDRFWNDQTMMCRGLILDGQGNVVARPFPKFFNLEEYTAQGKQLPQENFVVTEKFDGSLGILYWLNDEPHLATRGSFISDQAIKGTEMLRQFRPFPELDRTKTYLFEIIYPANRIVVDYGGREMLVLLAVIDTETGKEMDIYEYESDFPFAGYISGITSPLDLLARQENNKEGFVVRFDSGLRVKVKFEEYVRLHRLITGVNARRIWDLLRNNQTLDELLERVPDEFFKWVSDMRDSLVEQFEKTERVAKQFLEEAEKMETRKDQAIYLRQHCPFPGVVFTMLDKKDYSAAIWKMLRPAHEVPFKIEI